MADRDFVPGLAKRLKAARAAAGLSQQKAAAISGVHAISIARFETEVTTPSIRALCKLAVAYGVSACELLPEHGKRGRKRR